MFNDYTDMTFNWLDKIRADQIKIICRQYAKDVIIKHVPQERGVLGCVKLLVRVHAHSWRESVEIVNQIRKTVNDNKLSDSSTY